MPDKHVPLPCLDAGGVEGWTCIDNDGTGLWCANCIANEGEPDVRF